MGIFATSGVFGKKLTSELHNILIFPFFVDFAGMATDSADRRQAIRSGVVRCVEGVLRWVVCSRSRGTNDENAVGDTVSETRSVYAARKKARIDRESHPREFDPVDPLSFVSGSPDRAVVVTNREHRLPRSLSGMRVVMEQWTPEEWRAHVRMSKELFFRLASDLSALLPPRAPGTGGKPERPLWAKLGAVLGWLGGARPQDVQEIWGMRRGCFRRSVEKLLPALVKSLGKYIRWPSTWEELDTESERFSQSCLFGGAIGALDGLIVPMKCISEDLRLVMYNQRKDCYGFNVQAVANSRDMFIFVSVSHYASVHDGRAFKDSGLWSELVRGALTDAEHPPGTYFLLADNAYSLRSFCLHPWKGRPAPGTRADTFNLHLSTGRSTIERCFGQSVMAFPILKKGIDVKDPEFAAQIIQVCFLLHNFRKSNGEVGQIQPFPTRDAAPSEDPALASPEGAQDYVRGMGDDLVGERLPEERREEAVDDARTGRMKRRELAQMLLEAGLHRSGSVPDFTTPFPEESAEDMAGLIEA